MPLSRTFISKDILYWSISSLPQSLKVWERYAGQVSQFCPIILDRCCMGQQKWGSKAWASCPVTSLVASYPTPLDLIKPLLSRWLIGSLCPHRRLGQSIAMLRTAWDSAVRIIWRWSGRRELSINGNLKAIIVVDCNQTFLPLYRIIQAFQPGSHA